MKNMDPFGVINYMQINADDIILIDENNYIHNIVKKKIIIIHL